jgi:acyl-coenzyme A synthetase/AMP-(fatty) acid ligase
VKVMAVDLRRMEGEGTPVDERHVARGDEAIMRIALTSGSTGEPKAIALSHDMIMRRAWHYMLTLGDDFMRCSRVFSDLGLGSDMCVRLMLHLLSRGGTMFLPGATPMDTLQGFELYRVEGMIASPGGLSAIVKFYEETPAFRSSFSVIATAGSALHRSLSQRVRARLCSDLLFYYGSSETGIVAAAPAHVVADVAGSVGHVAAGVSVTIAGDDGRALPAGEEGAVRIASATTVAGYVGDADETAAAFRNGGFVSGDLGYFTRDGLLVISGRARDVLNLGGVKVKPEAIEDVLAAFPAVAEAAAFAVPNQAGIDEVRALVVANGPLDSGALKAHCQQRLPPPLVPVQVMACDKLPRNDNGKIERHRLKSFADNGKSP